MSTLHDRLADLAEVAAPASPRPASDLWVRGRSRQRRRRAGTATVLAVAAAVLAILGVTSLPQLHRDQPAPADSGSGGLPDRLYSPSPWLPGTDDAGPLGPLAVVSYAERTSLLGTTRDAPFGVSAATGTYRFLDLPDDAHDTASLSPDGHFLAYWTAGVGAETSRRVTNGVAVYDTTTGRVRTDRIATSYGLSGQTLVWSNENLVVQYAQARAAETDGGVQSGPPQPPLVWHLADNDSAPVRLPEPDRLGYGVFGASADGLVVWLDSGLAVVDPTTGQVRTRFPQVTGLAGTAAPSPDLSRLAVLTNGGVPVTVLTPGRRRVVPGAVRSSTILGWADQGHVVVVADGQPADVETSIASVDVDTGVATTLVDLGTDPSSVLVASGLLARPTVAAHRPPSPADRRVAAGLGAGVVLVAAGVLLIGWRRRVRV